MDNLLEYICDEPSEHGLKVAKLLDDWVGLHHINNKNLKEVDWKNTYSQTIKLPGMFSTIDSDDLTRLVFLAHDYCIRVEITPRSNRSLELMFHCRKRKGGFWQRHPTLENAIEQWRKNHKEIIENINMDKIEFNTEWLLDFIKNLNKGLSQKEFFKTENTENHEYHLLKLVHRYCSEVSMMDIIEKDSGGYTGFLLNCIKEELENFKEISYVTATFPAIGNDISDDPVSLFLVKGIKNE